MVLHINGNYPHHSLHRALASKLADFGFEQHICIPMIGNKYRDVYRLDRLGVYYDYASILTWRDRIFFLSKVKKIAKHIESSVDMKNIECILAHTLYSDGAVARILSKKYGIPFSVVVRNTDINTHMKYRPYLDWLVERIAYEAKNIILITPSYYEKIVHKIGTLQSEKICIIPNAVDDFWFESRAVVKDLHAPVELISVGEINKNKNLGTTLKIIKALNDRGITLHFTVVGDGKLTKKYKRAAKRLGVADSVSFEGWQNSKEKIKEYYEKSDIFIMLSFKETFGAVYIEALSQGLPIIYTRNQGVDGYFQQGSVGYSCDPRDVDCAAESLIKIIERYSDISKESLLEAKRFSIEKTAFKYKQVIDRMMYNEP